MRATASRTWTVVGLVSTVLVGGLYAVWTTRDRASDSDAGWLSSLATVQGEWVSHAGFAYDGTEPWTAPVRLTITGGELRLHAGCNHLSAEVTIEDHRLQAAGGVVSTEMGCPPEPGARDAWLAALVDDRATVQLKGSTDGPMLAFDTDAGWIGFIRPADTRRPVAGETTGSMWSPHQEGVVPARDQPGQDSEPWRRTMRVHDPR